MRPRARAPSKALERAGRTSASEHANKARVSYTYTPSTGPIIHTHTHPRTQCGKERAARRDARVVTRRLSRARIRAAKRSKGNRVNIPEPDVGDRTLGSQCGNATEHGDASVDPGKSSLFFVRSGLPGIRLSRDRDVASVKRRASRGVRCIGVGP